MLKTGDMVRFVGKRCNPSFRWDPPFGTVGEVLRVDSQGHPLVRWPEGVTPQDGVWWVLKDLIEIMPSAPPAPSMDCSCLAENLSELFDE